MSQELADAKIVALTTYRRDGTPVVTPMWIATGAGGLVSMTDAASFKVKRIQNNPSVTLAVSDFKGNVEPGATTYTATATVLSEQETLAASAAVRSKYGLMAKVIGFINRLRGESDRIGLSYSLTT